jgi:hypothetical protein
MGCGCANGDGVRIVQFVLFGLGVIFIWTLARNRGKGDDIDLEERHEEEFDNVELVESNTDFRASWGSYHAR